MMLTQKHTAPPLKELCPNGKERSGEASQGHERDFITHSLELVNNGEPGKKGVRSIYWVTDTRKQLFLRLCLWSAAWLEGGSQAKRAGRTGGPGVGARWAATLDTTADRPQLGRGLRLIDVLRPAARFR